MRNGEKKELARNLRRRAIDSEQALWRRLRDRGLRDQKFRRQRPIGRYVVDFVCLNHRLVVEIDGGQHGQQANDDQRRTKFMEAKGFRVLRFWNHEVLTNIEGVLQTLENALSSPHPDPLPLAGEGEEEPCRTDPLPRAGEGGTRRKAAGG